MVVEAIQNDERLEVLSYDFKEPLTLSKIMEKEDEYALTLQSEIKDFYRQCGGVKLRWKMRNEKSLNINIKGTVEGSIRILDIDTMIMAFDGRHWYNELWSDEMDEELKRFKKRLKIFDYFGNDNVDATCLELNGNVLMPKLWVNNLDYGIFPLHIDFQSYIDLLLKTRGIWGWQFFYADMNWSNSNHAIRNQAEDILEAFPLLFGNEPLLKELKDKYSAKMEN